MIELALENSHVLNLSSQIFMFERLGESMQNKLHRFEWY